MLYDDTTISAAFYTEEAAKMRSFKDAFAIRVVDLSFFTS